MYAKMELEFYFLLENIFPIKGLDLCFSRLPYPFVTWGTYRHAGRQEGEYSWTVEKKIINGPPRDWSPGPGLISIFSSHRPIVEEPLGHTRKKEIKLQRRFQPQPQPNNYIKSHY
jgi:hypothetical protein